MNKRQALLSFAVLITLPGSAFAGVPQPYKVSLVSGAQVDELWQAGILIELEPDWKTYWRVPGDAGIPPQFDWSGFANVETVNVEFPTPVRFKDASGEAIGYHDKVLFPISVKPKDPSQKVQLKLNMFFAVCQGVCIPAKAQLDLVLSISSSSPLLTEWQQKIPIVGEIIATNARIDMREGKANLVLEMVRAVDDVFVEADTQIYFGQPRFDVSPGEAWLPLANTKDMPNLQKLPLKLTRVTGNTGIAPTITDN